MVNFDESAQKPTVLVVDDTPDHLSLMSEMLEDEYRVRIANNGAKALKIAGSANPPDIILLDIMMPVMDGYEVCRCLKENSATRDIPIIFLTAKAEVEDEMKGFSLGAVDYITKPISFPIVQARVKTHLELKKRTLELAAVNEKLAAVNQKLMETNARTTETLYMVTHDLRTPMTSIVGFSRLISNKFKAAIVPLVSEFGTDKVEKAKQQIIGNLQIIEDESSRLTNLINDFLDISKLEEGKVTLNLERIRLEDLIISTGKSFQTLFKQKNLSLIYDFKEELPEITGDREKLIQILINLLSNAVKFTQQGSVTVKVFREDDYLVTGVSDTGCGISEGDQAHVFEKFTQISDEGGSGQKGTGLGLPICKQIITLLNGRIWVEAEPGHGSTFYFSLPVN